MVYNPSIAGSAVIGATAALWMHSIRDLGEEESSRLLRPLLLSALVGAVTGLLIFFTSHNLKYLDLGILFTALLYPLISVTGMAIVSRRYGSGSEVTVGIGQAAGISLILSIGSTMNVSALEALLYPLALTVSLAGAHALASVLTSRRAKLSPIPLAVVYCTMLLWWWGGSPAAALLAGLAEGLFMYYLSYSS